MDSAFDNSNGATLDNLNEVQDIFQKSGVLTACDLDMDIKNTNITTPSIDTLNNIQSYTIDNQKSSEIIDQNRISSDDYIIDENNHTAPRNGKASEFVTSDNYFGPESNVDDDNITDSPVTDELITKEDDIENSINILQPDDVVTPTHGILFENMDLLKTVDEAEECEKEEDVDEEDGSFREKANELMFSADTPTDPRAESAKLDDEVLGEKIEDPVEDNIQAENVIVPESGEESEDEWNYIKVNQNANENEAQQRNNISHETLESQNTSHDLVIDNQKEDDEIVAIEESSLSEADMASQLNPDAKEFVPTSPSPTNITPSNISDVCAVTATMATLHLNLQDDLVAQSPRKAIDNAMVDVPVPEENDFLNDITQRPADLDSTGMSDIRPGSSSSQCSYQEMNLKEAMHGDEKQEYAPDVLTSPDQNASEVTSSNVDHEQFIDILNKSMRNQDVMNASFYNDGSSDSNNPFKVDLNAVHRLPSSDDENEEEQLEVTGTTGTTFSFEDTEFGMNDVIQLGTENGLSGVENGSSEPQSIEEPHSIVGAVQEMISENMAVLGDCHLLGSDATATTENVLSETVENINTFVEEVAAPIVPDDLVSFETENCPTKKEPTVEPVVEQITEQVVERPLVEPVVEPFVEVVVEPIVEAADEPIVEPVVEPTVEPVVEPIVEAVVEPVVEQILEQAVETVAEQVEEPVVSNIISEQSSAPEPERPSGDVESQVVTELEPVLTNGCGEAAVAVTAATAVAAVAVTAVGVAAAKGKSTKPAVEPKSKTTSVAAKKPLSSGVTAKPKPKPTATDATANKAAPTARPRTVTSQPPVKALDKKPATSLAARKPVNGEVKTTTTTTAKKPISSTTTSKPTISARSTATSTTTTTTTRVTTSRLTTKSSTASTATDAPKRTTTTKTTTTTSSTLKPRTATERPASTLTKSPISKANTSATDKTAKDSVNKLQTSSARAPVSPRNLSATSKTGTLPAKTTVAAKVPSAAAPFRRPVSSTLEKKAPVGTANSKLAPTQKRPMTATTNRSTTLETVKKTTSTIKKDVKSSGNATKETKPQENGNGTNGTHAFDMPNESNDAVNVEQEPVIM